MDIIRAEEIVKPTSTKKLFEVLPDYVKDQFRSPLKLHEFCQEMVALQGQYPFLIQEIESSVQDEAENSDDMNDIVREEGHGLIHSSFLTVQQI